MWGKRPTSNSFSRSLCVLNETKAATKKTYNQDFFAFEGNSK